jgi:hypothetical protein
MDGIRTWRGFVVVDFQVFGLMLFPTAYFPSIHYLKSLCQSKEVVIDQHEHWIKQSIRNRCEILNASGLQKLVVPIIHEEGKQSLGSVRVDDAKKWRENHWKSIKTAYGKSPYFEYYKHEIEGCLFCLKTYLVSLNHSVLNLFIKAWELPIVLHVSNKFMPYSENDQRCKNWLLRTESHAKYQQVFQPKSAAIFNPSSLDLLCCEGPLGRKLLIN